MVKKTLSLRQKISKNDPSRRDFLVTGASAFTVIGGGVAAWPFVASLNPAADVSAHGTLDIDLSNIEPGHGITVKWRGKPIFVRRRTPDEIMQAEHEDSDIDPQPDEQRVERKEWIVVIGICTHLGCVPSGERASEPRGQWGGWFCACHGSQYDISGRVRKGPAPYNLAVPPYVFVDDKTIRIGVRADAQKAKT